MSFLGTGNYSKTVYCKDGNSYESRYILESLIHIACADWDWEQDKISVFLTAEAKKKEADAAAAAAAAAVAAEKEAQLQEFYKNVQKQTELLEKLANK